MRNEARWWRWELEFLLICGAAYGGVVWYESVSGGIPELLAVAVVGGSLGWARSLGRRGR